MPSFQTPSNDARVVDARLNDAADEVAVTREMRLTPAEQPGSSAGSISTGSLPAPSWQLPWFSLRGVPAFAMVIVAVLPFWLIPVAHLASESETATGFFHEELPYYMANGRAAFDRGNGFLYPNPYDPDQAAPAIYGHWLLWGLGVFPAWLEWDPGQVMLCATCVASLVFSAVTWHLVRECSVRPDRSHSAFLAAMWGGGLLAIAGAVVGLSGVSDPASTILQFDPGRGLWFLNWGRNATFATESVYHALVAACWLSEIRGRRIAGTLFCFALATTHPWSGLELLLTLNLWRCCQWLRERNGRNTAHLLSSAILLAAFLGYYKIWLPRFEQHARLQQVWELNWNLSTASALLAYSLVGVFAVRRLLPATFTGTSNIAGDEDLRSVRAGTASAANASEPRRLRSEHFLCCALLVAVALAFHDRLIRPVQPLHFTRGYIWMPLFLLGLPVLQRWWERQISEGPRGRFLVTTFAALLCTDNIAFVGIQSHWQWTQEHGYHLSIHDRVLLKDLQQRSPGAVVLTESTTLNYLLPAYASLRPWLGHPFNTPDFKQRELSRQAALPPGRVVVRHLAEDVDVLAIQRNRDTTELQQSARWIELESQNPQWQLWGQVSPSALDRSER